MFHPRLLKGMLVAMIGQWPEALTTEPSVRSSGPWYDQTCTHGVESRQLSVIPSVGIRSWGHIEGKDQDTARGAQLFSVLKLPSEAR